VQAMLRKSCQLLVVLGILVAAFANGSARARGDEKTWLLNQINALRGQLGLHAYAWNNQLGAAAQQHSDYMAATGDISHTESNGSTPASRAVANGYTGGWVSENIYGGTLATAADAWNFWVNSSIHYAGLTNSNTNEIGIGVAGSGIGQFYTLVFGRGDIVIGSAPTPANPVPDTSNGATSPSQAPAPTRRPAPSRTFTPSPTIPTFTPTATWTFTPTWTATPSPTTPPPTGTLLVLPTAAVITPLATLVVQFIGSTAQAQNQSQATTTPRHPQIQARDRFSVHDLLPYLLAGQVILIGIGIFSFFIRRKT
jgi:hypothetical protein